MADDWNPPAHLRQPFQEVRDHVEATYPDPHGFRDYGWDQVMAYGGYLNFRVRWDSSRPVSAQLRDRIHETLPRQYQEWTDVMLDNAQGHNAWPHTGVPVTVVGWAVLDRATLRWDDDSVDIDVNDLREGAARCAGERGRFFNQDGDALPVPGRSGAALRPVAVTA